MKGNYSELFEKISGVGNRMMLFKNFLLYAKKFKTEDEGIVYTYMVTQEGNKITVESNILVADSFFPKEYFPAFKQIFDAITKYEGQLVTVVKK